jgi:hypothetical protein
MRYLKIAGLCLASMLVMGMTLAGNAAAGPLWLVCLEGPEKVAPTKYTNHECNVAARNLEGVWQSLGLPAGKSDTVRLRAFSLRLTDTKTAAGESSIECPGGGSKGWGLIENVKVGIIKVATVEEASKNCKRLSGGCEEGKIEEVNGIHLPWKTEIVEEGGELVSKIVADGNGEPGWEVRCHTLLGSKTDICETEGAANAERVKLLNGTTEGVLLVLAVFTQTHSAKCSEGGVGAGHVLGLVAVLLWNGWGLSVNKE